jgi:uncharacterized repeat protein (TIGR01451 family)
VQGGKYGIAGVPVVLQDINTQKRLGIYTSNAGKYIFHNVPQGDYRLVEAYGEQAAPSPGNFGADAQIGPTPIAAVPPISFVSNPPAGATNLDCVTPNTIYFSAGSSNVDADDILNGPVAYIPIETMLDNCAEILPNNLVTQADSGTFGFFEPGISANTGADPNPYPGLAPDFEYVLPDPNIYVPDDGQYTIQNIVNNAKSNLTTWWRIADRTKGNEQGRLMLVNGSDPGSVFFEAEVAVMPNTNYVMSAWILNMFKLKGYADPALGVQILDESGEILYSETLGQKIPPNTLYPEWRQIGTAINSKDNSSLTIKFVSDGPAALGNDYAIDDISFNEIILPYFKPVKSVDNSVVCVGDTVTYTVIIENTCSHPLTEVFFIDILPEGLEFVSGSVTVNGLEIPDVDPEQGFDLPNIAGKEKAEVTFMAVAVAVPSKNPTTNTAEVDYRYAPVKDGIADYFMAKSDKVSVLIKQCDETCHEVNACEKTKCTSFEVSVPVNVTPFTNPKKPKVGCKSGIEVIKGHKQCESKENIFKFTIAQRLDIDMPIDFDAKVCFDETCAEDKGKCLISDVN